MKLTDKKGNKYFAMASADSILQKLNKLEHEAPVLLAKLCDGYCMYPQVLTSQDALEEKCERCPMAKLMEMTE